MRSWRSARYVLPKGYGDLRSVQQSERKCFGLGLGATCAAFADSYWPENDGDTGMGEREAICDDREELRRGRDRATDCGMGRSSPQTSELGWAVCHWLRPLSGLAGFKAGGRMVIDSAGASNKYPGAPAIALPCLRRAGLRVARHRGSPADMKVESWRGQNAFKGAHWSSLTCPRAPAIARYGH